MEREGYVSLWIGSAKSDDELWEYAQMIYTEDGDYLPSQFLKDFDIDEDEFDEDFMERSVVNSLICVASRISWSRFMWI